MHLPACICLWSPAPAPTELNHHPVQWQQCQLFLLACSLSALFSFQHLGPAYTEPSHGGLVSPIVGQLGSFFSRYCVKCWPVSSLRGEVGKMRWQALQQKELHHQTAFSVTVCHMLTLIKLCDSTYTPNTKAFIFYILIYLSFKHHQFLWHGSSDAQLWPWNHWPPCYTVCNAEPFTCRLRLWVWSVFIIIFSIQCLCDRGSCTPLTMRQRPSGTQRIPHWIQVLMF